MEVLYQLSYPGGRLTIPPPPASVTRPSARLSQADGSQRLVGLRVHLHPDLSAVAERPDLGKMHVDGKSGRLRGTALADYRHHSLTGVV